MVAARNCACPLPKPNQRPSAGGLFDCEQCGGTIRAEARTPGQEAAAAAQAASTIAPTAPNRVDSSSSDSPPPADEPVEFIDPKQGPITREPSTSG